ncbi:hypothetical protein FHX75_1593 [Micromonospora palomenae]|uniref:VWFA domain-containing protein n=1 Tax=Micromonospora palomenae TaxID=1461247 RepID=A0A561VHA4_9ACTN|nr:hypothetical protein [Micromonospora palomenae]TWG11005.1 hypothetical protein FHX75_1593 [Micromonospora palomenae]
MTGENSGDDIRPIYLCIDDALLTERARPLAQRRIAELVRQIQHSALLPQLRVSALSFSAQVHTLHQLAELDATQFDPIGLRHADRPPSHLSPRFDVLFTHLRRQIGQDVQQLQADGFAVRRPCVCLFTDGWAGDDWSAAYEELTAYDSELQTGFAARPDIVAVPVDSPDLTALRHMVMPRRRSSIVPCPAGTHGDIDVEGVLRVLLHRTRPLLMGIYDEQN